MRIAFVIRSLFHYTSELANSLARAGHEVVVIAHDGAQDFVGFESGDVRSDFREILDPHVSLEWVPIPDNTRFDSLIDNLKSITAIRRLIRKHNPDILHIHRVADYRIFTAVAMSRRKVVMTIHDAELHPGDHANKQQFVGEWAQRLASAVIVHGADIEHRLIDMGKVPANKINRIPHGPYTIYHRWVSNNPPRDAKKVLFFGRVRLYKGLDYLIKSAPIVCESVPDAKFVIAGSGPDWSRCKELIADPSQFILHEKRISEQDVTKLFEEASVVVLPYIEASQSGVLFIAYELGKPVIVTRVGSLPEVVDDGKTGLVIPPADEHALAGAIIKVLQEDDLRVAMGENARQKVASGDLSWDSIAAKTVSLYTSLFKRG